MSQESSASELEMAKEYSVVLADTDDEDDRYLVSRRVLRITVFFSATSSWYLVVARFMLQETGRGAFALFCKFAA